MGAFIDLFSGDDALAMRVYQALPSAPRGPVVIVLQEIFGVNIAMRAVADDLAEQGFVALVPDLFWRLEPGINLGYDKDDHKKAVDYWQRFDPETGIADVVATIKAARALSYGSGKVAILGFCLGGQLAVKAAARTPVDAVISFYGIQLGKSLEDIASLQCPSQFHFGDADPHCPIETRSAIQGLAQADPKISMYVYPGAGHAFFNSFRPHGFHASAHEASRSRAFAMLHDVLDAAAAQDGNL
jgi:carboxymethylenebutenolidase